MPGLIDEEGTTGLAYTTGAGLQFESRIGNVGLIINPGESASGYVLTQGAGYILLQDGLSFILLQG